jgi:cytochrome b561
MNYDRVAIGFHWVLALLIAGMATLGFLLESFPRQTQLYWINIHVCVGIVYFALVLARLAWRVGHRPPDLPVTISPLIRTISVASHHLMYLLMILIPVVGIVALVWHGRGFDFGLFRIDLGIASNRPVYSLAEGVHGKLVFALLALAVLHTAAALWHQYVQRDGVLARMVPWLAER